MKKNKMMRLASILLVCVLLTTSVISGTFAKYVTTDSASDTARVAKWGIDVLVSGNLFGAAYNTNAVDAAADKDIIAASSTNVSSNAVIDWNNDSKADDIIAPGTKNTIGLTIKLSGTPEVAYKVTARTGKNVVASGVAKPINEDIFLGEGTWGVMVKAEGLNIASDVTGLFISDDAQNFTPASGTFDSDETYYELHDKVTVEGGSYYPINWTVTESGRAKAVTSDAASKKNLVDIANKMVANIVANADADDKESDFFKANTNADTKYVLTWEWPFEDNTKDATATGYTVAANDAKDTILGNLIADKYLGTDSATEGIVVIKATSGEDYGIPTEQAGETLNNYNLDVVFNFDVIVEQVD